MKETPQPKLRVSRGEAYKRIKARIEEGQLLRRRSIGTDSGLDKARMESQNWSKCNIDLLITLFDTPAQADEYKNCDRLLSYVIEPRTVHLPGWRQSQISKYQMDMKCSISKLEEICDQLERFDDPSDISQREVFIVHGRDNEAKISVAGFIKKLGLEPIILDEQPNSGLTIIEKFAQHASNVGFAIVLITPDDVGALKDEDELQPRARQNVILELGYFLHRLGRERVCVLHKGKVELPSDMQGILYVPMNNPNEWQLQLAKEMKQAGLPINPEKLL